MNYIGSKYKLLGRIRKMLEEHDVNPEGVFCDIFSGTSVVGQMAKRLGFTVYSNDIQAYSYALQSAFIGCNGYPQFARLRAEIPEIDAVPVECQPERKRWTVRGEVRPLLSFGVVGDPEGLLPAGRPLLQVLAYLNHLAPREGAFVDTYCEGGSAGRNYYSRRNGMACQAIRDTLEEWRRQGWVDEAEFHVLLASLVESMDMVANTASIYGAYLKHLKPSAAQPLQLRVPLLLNGHKPHRVYRRDANALVGELAAEAEQEILYIDPPYNRRQYHANYHLLETIACWDLEAFTPVGKTGLRPDEGKRSAFAMRTRARTAMADLLEKARFRHILVSYNNEGLIEEEELIAMLDRKSPSGIREYSKFTYPRFRADVDSANRVYKGDEVQEFLFYIRTG